MVKKILISSVLEQTISVPVDQVTPTAMTFGVELHADQQVAHLVKDQVREREPRRDSEERHAVSVIRNPAIV